MIAGSINQVYGSDSAAAVDLHRLTPMSAAREAARPRSARDGQLRQLRDPKFGGADEH
jgi:hypothetical protein